MRPLWSVENEGQRGCLIVTCAWVYMLLLFYFGGGQKVIGEDKDKDSGNGYDDDDDDDGGDGRTSFLYQNPSSWCPWDRCLQLRACQNSEAGGLAGWLCHWPGRRGHGRSSCGSESLDEKGERTLLVWDFSPMLQEVCWYSMGGCGTSPRVRRRCRIIVGRVRVRMHMFICTDRKGRTYWLWMV